MKKAVIDLLLFKSFLIAGTLTFSGGVAMIPQLRKDLAENKKLISTEEFDEYATIAQTLPGVIALTTACFIGKKCNGIRGLIWAAIGTVLPAYTIMLLATILYGFIPNEGPAIMALTGIRATAGAFVFAAGVSLAKHNLKDRLSWVIACFSFLMIALFNVSAPYVLLISAIAGIIYSMVKVNK